MNDLIVGFALVLVFEGLLWAAFPDLANKLLLMAAQTPQETLDCRRDRPRDRLDRSWLAASD